MNDHTPHLPPVGLNPAIKAPVNPGLDHVNANR